MIARLRTAGLRLFCFARRAHRFKLVTARSDEKGITYTDECMTCGLFNLRRHDWDERDVMSRFRGQA